VYLAAQGIRAVGLDFAQDTLSEIRKRSKSLILCAGDVGALPFAAEAFDLYYSGGVVEHFEAGAEPALKEAHRVLRPGGLLLISVPYYSPLRHLLVPVKRNNWKRVSQSVVESSNPYNGLKFFQYAYTQREFKRLLGDYGFHVRETQGYAILWGLYDMPFAERALNMMARSKNRAQSVTGEHTHPEPDKSPGTLGNHRPAISLPKLLAVGEDDSVPVAGRVVRALRLACANMMMYVCERIESA
jgi:ubiquinone/menaquinone biosynthesis C-methylase UbiE